ncbi:MAG: hypothetical protein CL927_08160 [Deltaproteobacteria bacterium]|nr:hypothetical protein [Deltaproteobacteria bacterium]HCH64145.1 hypothetical protein [Deltaproteobacteria bacterium]
MALLIRQRDGVRFLASDLNLIGRDHACDLQLTDERVSQHHARLALQDGEWRFEDLGSRNGSSINGRPSAPGAPTVLAVDDVLIFGTPKETWQVQALSAPGLLARSVTGTTVTGGDHLSLPSSRAPEATIYRQPTGRWVMEGPDQVRPIRHRELVVVQSTPWRVFLPDTQRATVESDQRSLGIREVTLHFSVSSDEEDVEITVRGGTREQRLRQRSHSYLLLTLARERMADQVRSDVPEAEQGWVYRDDLCSMLRLTKSVMFLQIHRARKQLEAAGVANAFDLVERRAGSGQLRLGVAQLEVQRRGAEDGVDPAIG